MRRISLSKVLFLVFLFIIPLALAVTSIQTSSSLYAVGDSVVISGTCSSPSSAVGLRALLEGENVWFEEVTSAADNKYSASFVPPQKGTYTVHVACQGDSSVTATFCVGTAQECGVATGGEGGGTPSGSPGGGGYDCVPKWTYASWSFCNTSLKQSRVATDLNKCKKQPKQEDVVRSCSACEELWTCSEWSECVDGTQARTCLDEHGCSTFALRPNEQRICEEDSVVPPKETKSLPRPSPPQITPSGPSFWDQYGLWVVGIPFVIIIFVLIVWLLSLLRKKQKRVYDPKEIKEWSRKEMAAGTSLEDVKEIIARYTGWSKEQIEATVSRPFGKRGLT